jgi:CBS-domain-containing membrane protein
MPDLSTPKDARRLRIYIDESDRWRGKPLESALLETLRAHGIAGATVFRGIAGYGAHSRIRTSAIEVLSMDLPVVVETIDSPEKIAAILEVIYPMVQEGLITLENVQMIQYTHRHLNPLPADRLVSEVMTRDVVAIPAQDSVFQAWKRLLENQVKAMPVVGPSGQVVGILTDADLLERGGIGQRFSIAIRMEAAEIEQELRALAQSTKRVEEVMSQPAITVQDSDTLGAATTHMIRAGLKRMPVVNETGTLVGMLSRLDILRTVAHRAPPIHATEQNLQQAGRRVQDIMTVKIPMVSLDEDLSGIIDAFARSNSHRLIVVDAQGKAVGLLSDSDVVVRVQPSRRKNVLEALRQVGKPAPGKETAFDLMSPGPLTAPPDMSILDALQTMLAESRKWLVVVDEDGKPLGLVDRQILLEAVIQR